MMLLVHHTSKAERRNLQFQPAIIRPERIFFRVSAAF